jgi:hypothetical protein
MGSITVALNGSEMWAYVVEHDNGLRMQVMIDDWENVNLDTGRRIPIRLPGRDDIWLFLTQVPPIVWVMLGRRMPVAG